LKHDFGSDLDSKADLNQVPDLASGPRQSPGSEIQIPSADIFNTGLAASPGFDFGAEIFSALDSLRSVARESFLPVGANAAPSVQTVQAPVNIQVTSHAAAPEAVARSVYDTAQRSLLKTLKGVFV
jgi:hypothetical protein